MLKIFYMSHSVQDQVNAWGQAPFDKQTQEAVVKLKKDPDALEDAFYKDLAFGTGGMRGIMGVGTNRVNKYTFGRITQGLSNYLKPLEESSAAASKLPRRLPRGGESRRLGGSRF